MADFTPGPWTALTNGNYYNSSTIVTCRDDADGWICEVFDDMSHATLPDVANAHLIAAAPDLYGVLNKYWDDNGGFFKGVSDEDAALIRAAISKAHPTQGDE